MILAPLLASVDAWPLDPPERPRRGVLPRGHAHPGLLHLVRERVEDADHDDAVGPAVEAPVHSRGDLVPAVEDPRVREDDDSARGERRREIPLAPAIEALEGAALAELLVLRPVERVDLGLQARAVEVAHSGAGLSV